MKKTLALFLSCAMLLCSLANFSTAVFAEINATEQHHHDLIRNVYDKINDKDWTGYADCYAPSIRQDRLDMVSSEWNMEHNQGILDVKHATILEIAKLDDRYCPDPYFYPTFSNIFSDTSAYDCYYVRADLDVYTPKKNFVNGINEHVITIVKENGEWYIGAMCRYEPIDLTEDLTKHGGDILPTRTLAVDKANTYPYFSNSTQPSTIIVKYKNGKTYDVSFKEFIVNVTCNEIGGMDFATDAIVANIIAIKMCGWWATIANKNLDYDIQGGSEADFAHVAYIDGRYGGCNETQITKIRNLVTKYMDAYMISSSASGSKIFFPNYRAGKPDTAGGSGTGRMYQYGSDYLARSGKDWMQILHYYYDNSDENHINVGIVQIKCTNHVESVRFKSNATYHWHPCTKCEHKFSMTAHVWVSYGTRYRCSTCKRVQDTIPANGFHRGFMDICNLELKGLCLK